MPINNPLAESYPLGTASGVACWHARRRAFLLAADLLARRLHPPAGLLIGLVTALLGVLFFVSLLRKTSWLLLIDG